MLGRSVAFVTLGVTIATSRVASADEADRWFGPDKGIHFGASAAISAATYGVSAPHFDVRYAPLLIGAGVGIAAGVSKEVWDAGGYGTPSWKDFAWDALGVATGLVIAWSIDVLVRGRRARSGRNVSALRVRQPRVEAVFVRLRSPHR